MTDRDKLIRDYEAAKHAYLVAYLAWQEAEKVVWPFKERAADAMAEVERIEVVLDQAACDVRAVAEREGEEEHDGPDEEP